MIKYFYIELTVSKNSLVDHMNWYGNNGQRIVSVNNIDDGMCELIIETQIVDEEELKTQTYKV